MTYRTFCRTSVCFPVGICPALLTSTQFFQMRAYLAAYGLTYTLTRSFVQLIAGANAKFCYVARRTRPLKGPRRLRFMAAVDRLRWPSGGLGTPF